MCVSTFERQLVSLPSCMCSEEKSIFIMTSDLCSTAWAPGAGPLRQANEGAIAEVSEATCIYNNDVLLSIGFPHISLGW